MKHLIFTHSVFGKINTILDDTGRWYFNSTDMARAMNGKPYLEESMRRKIINNSPNKKEMPVMISKGIRKKMFIPLEDLSNVWTVESNSSETELKEWLYNCTGEIPKTNKLCDIIQNPDVGIQLLTELKAERELRRKAEDENEINKHKVNFADRIFQLITEMAEDITAS